MDLQLTQNMIGISHQVISDTIAKKVAEETENYYGIAEKHPENLMVILDKEGSDYAT